MKRRFLALDSFRGLFAFAVVIYHMHVAGSFAEAGFFRNSDIFVEFFFVLSGFVLTHGYANKAELNFKDFMISRSFRLYPLHLAMLMVFIAFEIGKLAVYNFGLTFDKPPFMDHKAVSEILPNLLLIHSWTPLTDSLSFNYPSWSISIEYYMYVLFFFTLLLPSRIRFSLWALMSVLAFALLLMKSELLVDKVQSGISCFFAGSMTYCLYKKFSSLQLGYAVSSFLEVLLFLLVVLVVSSNFETKHIVASLLFCTAVFFYAYEFGVISEVLKRGFFVRLGELSYSIYMVHAAVLFVFISAVLILQKLLGRTLALMVDGERVITLGHDWANNTLAICILAAVFIASVFSHKYIELPGRKLGRKFISGDKAYTSESKRLVHE